MKKVYCILLLFLFNCASMKNQGSAKKLSSSLLLDTNRYSDADTNRFLIEQKEFRFYLKNSTRMGHLASMITLIRQFSKINPQALLTIFYSEEDSIHSGKKTLESKLKIFFSDFEESQIKSRKSVVVRNPFLDSSNVTIHMTSRQENENIVGKTLCYSGGIDHIFVDEAQDFKVVDYNISNEIINFCSQLIVFQPSHWEIYPSLLLWDKKNRNFISKENWVPNNPSYLYHHYDQTVSKKYFQDVLPKNEQDLYQVLSNSNRKIIFIYGNIGSSTESYTYEEPKTSERIYNQLSKSLKHIIDNEKEQILVIDVTTYLFHSGFIKNYKNYESFFKAEFQSFFDKEDVLLVNNNDSELFSALQSDTRVVFFKRSVIPFPFLDRLLEKDIDFIFFGGQNLF